MAPGSEDDDMLVPGAVEVYGGPVWCGCACGAGWTVGPGLVAAETDELFRLLVLEPSERRGGAAVLLGLSDGEGGTELRGEGGSTIHMRWLRVATSLATVWARVETGVTWKTGYESLPSFMPRSERMTEMK